MPDLGELTAAAVESAEGDESVEAYAEESRRTEVDALRGEVEGLTFAEARGVGVRLLSGGRLGYAYAADPSPDEVRRAVVRARENAALAAPDEHNVLPEAEPIEPMPEVFRASQADIPTDRKVALALDVERRAVGTDPRVTKVDLAQVGDGVSRVAIASTTGMAAEYARTDAWAVCVTLAVEGDETQTGFSYRIARELGDLHWEDVVQRGRRPQRPDARRREAAHRPGAGGARHVRRHDVPGRALGGALGRGGAEGPVALRESNRRTARLRPVHARRRRPRARGPGRGPVRRRGRAGAAGPSCSPAAS